mgnify:CR=1 FL=1
MRRSFSRVAVVNRGEAALRFIHAARELNREGERLRTIALPLTLYAGGAWLDGEPIRVSGIDRLEQAAVSTGNLRTLARGERWAGWGEVVARVDRIRGYGDFYHYHLLASGRIDAVVESDVNILDIAALSLIVEEAGGRFTDFDGGSDLSKGTVAATNGHLHDHVLAALAGHGILGEGT